MKNDWTLSLGRDKKGLKLCHDSLPLAFTWRGVAANLEHMIYILSPCCGATLLGTTSAHLQGEHSPILHSCGDCGGLVAYPLAQFKMLFAGERFYIIEPAVVENLLSIHLHSLTHLNALITLGSLEPLLSDALLAMDSATIAKKDLLSPAELVIICKGINSQRTGEVVA